MLNNTETEHVESYVSRLLGLDLSLMAATMLILGFGVWLMFSVSAAVGRGVYDGSLFYARHQLVHAIAGLAVMLVTAFSWRRLMEMLNHKHQFRWAFGWAWLLLVAVLFMPGVIGMHASIPVISFKFYPAVFVGILLLVFVAARLGDKNKPFDMRTSVSTIAVVGVTLILIMLEGYVTLPMLIFMAIILMYKKAGLPLKYVSAMVGAMGLIIMLEIFSHPYRIERLMVLLFPADYPATYGYQNMMSLKLLSGAKLFGGASTDSLKLLPFLHTDFAFTALTAGVGWLASLIVTALLVFVVVRGLRIAKSAGSGAAGLLVFGLVFLFGGQAFLNISRCLGVVGGISVGLPFISYGGNDLIASSIIVGILLATSAGQKQNRDTAD